MELNRPFSLSFLPQNRLAICQVKRTSPERYVECRMQIFTSETFWIQLCLCQRLALFSRNYSRYFFACLIANAGVGFGAWYATASLHLWEWIMKLWMFHSPSKCQRCGQWNFKVVKMLRRLCWPVTRLVACATLSIRYLSIVYALARSEVRFAVQYLPSASFASALQQLCVYKASLSASAAVTNNCKLVFRFVR